MTTRITIVIPVRNDATALARLLDHLAGLRDVAASEIVVAAWGDPDGTERAVAGRARLIWPGGSTRASLMNAGAAVAGGDVLFFLHADSFPPPDALRLIAQTLADRRAVGGAFEHLFAERSASLRLITPAGRGGRSSSSSGCSRSARSAWTRSGTPSAGAGLPTALRECRGPDQTLPDTREAQTLPESIRRRRSS